MIPRGSFKSFHVPRRRFRIHDPNLTPGRIKNFWRFLLIQVVVVNCLSLHASNSRTFITHCKLNAKRIGGSLVSKFGYELKAYKKHYFVFLTGLSLKVRGGSKRWFTYIWMSGVSKTATVLFWWRPSCELKTKYRPTEGFLKVWSNFGPAPLIAVWPLPSSINSLPSIIRIPQVPRFSKSHFQAFGMAFYRLLWQFHPFHSYSANIFDWLRQNLMPNQNWRVANFHFESSTPSHICSIRHKFYLRYHNLWWRLSWNTLI